MHTFIHGDYHLASRNYLTGLIRQAASKNLEIVKLNGLTLAIEDFIQATTSTSLFGTSRLVVVENLLSRPKSKDLEKIFLHLKNYSGDTKLIFWEKKPIGKVLQRSLPKNTTIKEFKTPAVIFKLVEQLSPHNKKQALQTLDTVLQNEPAEFVFSMIARQIRLLLLVKNGDSVPGAPWMVGKLTKQAQAFTEEGLLTSYRKLYTIDTYIKTGRTVMPLNWHLTVWVSTL